jgi:hypothetical protein
VLGGSGHKAQIWWRWFQGTRWSFLRHLSLPQGKTKKRRGRNATSLGSRPALCTAGSEWESHVQKMCWNLSPSACCPISILKQVAISPTQTQNVPEALFTLGTTCSHSGFQPSCSPGLNGDSQGTSLWNQGKARHENFMSLARCCNPSYSGGRGQEDRGWKPTRVNSKTLLRQKPSQKRAGGVAQGEG